MQRAVVGASAAVQGRRRNGWGRKNVYKPKCAAVFSAALAVASCSGTPYQSTSGDDLGYEAGGIDTNWVWGGIALGLLFAFSSN